MKPYFIPLLLLSFMSLSCSDQSGTEPLENEEVSDTFSANHSLDWKNFVTAVQSKDKTSFMRYCSDKIKDHDGLLNMISEPFVLRKMEESKFDDLESVEIQGVQYLMFYAEDVGMDEFGYEYGTSVTLYFLETDSLLLLDNYSAAG